GTLHWVSAAEAIDVEVRLYDRLFENEDPDTAGDYRDGLNTDSLRVIERAKAEPGLATAEPGSRWQFERQGFFYLEPESALEGRTVFNRVVTLKDTWAKLVRQHLDLDWAEKQRQETERLEAVRSELRQHAAVPVDPLAGLSDPQREIATSLSGAHGVSVESARVLAAQKPLRDLFDAGVSAGAAPRRLANWIANELQRELEAAGVDAANAPFGGAALAELLALVDGGKLSATAAKTVLGELVREGGSPAAIVAARGLAQVSDEAALTEAVARVVGREAANAAAYRDGRTGLLGWFVGQVMKETGGRANPQLVQRLVRERLDDSVAG
ncbi:MAG TPA: glutamine--tRNA ligase, partial [Thermoanaerobaculia bacterium]|nr:glutamine--tRNA ligase [Thermoanaerobaculia bacterium]